MKRQNVICYYRVSTLSQDTSRQKTELLRLCKIMNYNVVKEIEENISGIKSWKERELNAVFDFDNLDGIVVLELSRFGRDAEDILTAIKQLHLKGIWLYSKNENLKTLDDNGDENTTSKLVLTILSGVAEMERSVIKQRSISGLIKNINDGNWTGGKFLPYGYKRVNKRLEIELEESKIIKKIFELYLSGNGTKRIANYLNDKEIPTRYNLVVSDRVKKPNKWKLTDDEIQYKNGEDFNWKDGTIYSILTNKVYIGEKEGKGKLKGINMFSPPIIEKDDFIKVQHSLKNTQKRTSTKYIYVLEGKPKCGICNSSYFPHKRSNNKDNAYKCLSIRYGKSCNNFGIGIPKLNAGVWTALRRNPKELENILEINKNKSDFIKDIEVLTEKKIQIEKEISSHNKRRENIVSLLVDGNVDKNNLYKIDGELNNKIKSLKEELDLIVSEIVSKNDFIKQQETAKNSLRIIKGDIHLLKATLNKVIQKLIVYPILQNKIENTFTNKQDKLVFIELYTFINITKPISFVISQRTKKFLLVDNNIKFDKATNILSINKEEVFEEEEEVDFIYRDLIEIESLKNSHLVENNSIQ
jgi:site-specific DNA recombinase